MNASDEESTRWEQIDTWNYRLFVVGVVAATLINYAAFGAPLASGVITAAFLIGVYGYLTVWSGGTDD